MDIIKVYNLLKIGQNTWIHQKINLELNIQWETKNIEYYSEVLFACGLSKIKGKRDLET